MPSTPEVPRVSVLLLTCNRLAFLQQSLATLLARTTVPFEAVVWDNGSADGSSEWLDTVRDPRVRVVHASGNLGVNGYALAAALARGEYLVEMDDDVLALPDGWAEAMLMAFARVPRLGYLALDVVQDAKTDGAKPPPEHYRRVDAGEGVVLELGPVGGWCTMTPRRVHDAVGGFPFLPGRRFFLVDAGYGTLAARAGYLAAILSGVRCYHACGPAWNAGYEAYSRVKYAEMPEQLRKYISLPCAPPRPPPIIPAPKEEPWRPWTS